MKVFVALAGLVAVTSAYPMFLLEDEAALPYAPVYRMARQAPVRMSDNFGRGSESEFVQQARRRLAEGDDLDTAADAPYAAAVSFITDTGSVILDLNTCNDSN